MSTLYQRQVSLIAMNSGKPIDGSPGLYQPGTATPSVDLSDLHIQFEVTAATTGSMKYAVIRVWNPARDTAVQILNEFTNVSLQVGYAGVGGNGEPMASLIDGQIAESRYGSADSINTYLEIMVQDGYKASVYGSMSKTIADGWTDDDVLNAILPEWGKYNITLGYKPTFSGNPAPRDKVLHGSLQDLTAEMAVRQSCDWFIEDGRLMFVPKGLTIPGDTVTLSTDSGMIGVPMQTYQGIEARCLLNPRIKVGRAIQIENPAISIIKRKNSIYGVTDPLEAVPSLNKPDQKFGNYKVWYHVHRGDSRGNEWETSIVCTSVDGVQPTKGPSLNYMTE